MTGGSIGARNVWGFGLGTLGRDMLAALVAMYLMFYLTEVVDISASTVVAVTVIMVVMRVFDAVNDPVMGIIVDNTRSRWGKFKPWIAIGALAWAAASILMFADWGLEGTTFLIMFTVVYLLWEIAYTVNDISYYGMLPSLSRDRKQRERIGVVARVCANVGLFSLVVGVLPITKALAEWTGSLQRGWFTLAVILSIVMVAFQAITLVVAKEEVRIEEPATTPLRELFSVIVRNDQLLWVTFAMMTFMTGYLVTTSLGIYYFRYVYGDEDMYSIFAAVLGITQIAGLAIFPLVARFLTRRQIHLVATALCVFGFGLFFFADSSMLLIGVAGVLLFSGQAFIQLLMLLYIADCAEYGEWKLGRRNESITVSLQPFIYKGSNALASGIVGLTLLASGIASLSSDSDASAIGDGVVLVVKIAMMVVPMVLATLSWLILRMKYRIDEPTYARIVSDLKEREA
ncbi:sugar transporter [Bowdeniella nasicola]|uniref:Sugar transporter n=1 Tax=Bowdeniella nasicola TaxID=208480 RepID=A0A1Q5PZQ5_9ACTO|nr:glycoside-pentoside-hexuronide (GPH):cation symporter [Bowdeniella nasicola]OKL52935.1 sugar transporter [Bowdeniella nasicola]